MTHNHYHNHTPPFFRQFTFSDADINEESIYYLVLANGKSEWLWMIYLKYFMGMYLIVTPINAAISILFCWIRHGTFDAKFVYHPFKLVFVSINFNLDY